MNAVNLIQIVNELNFFLFIHLFNNHYRKFLSQVGIYIHVCMYVC